MIYIFYGLAFSVFPLSLKRLELSTAYAVWSGVGTIITAIIGFVWFHDTINWTKILALVAIVGGCVVLQFADDRDAKD
jgi:small multidrug resistance pump